MKENFKLPSGWVLSVLLVTLTLVEAVRSTPPLGAQQAACGDVTLEHHGIKPQASAAPYQLEVSADAVVAGQTLSVVLSSHSGELFEGFFIQAWDVASDEIIGIFQTAQGKYVDCKSGVKNAVTHSDDSKKTSITVDWIAPEDYDGVVVLRATVVQQSRTFWVDIESTEVLVTRARSLVNTRTPETAEEAYEGCGETKACFGIMGNCIDSKDCMVVITSAPAEPGYYSMEVFGIAADDSTDVYMAGGLSFDTNMANTSVMACRSYNGVVDVVMAFNTVGHANDILPIPDMGLTDISVSHVDDLLYCSFTREASLVIGGYLYDMDNEQFYIEVAHGNLSDTGALTIHKHHGTTNETHILSELF